MTEGGQSIAELKKAYRVLGVLETASALTIKASYRKLIKRWHPDKPATAAATAAEASQMTKMINEAYALIANAPLRYYAGEAPSTTASATKTGTAKTTVGTAAGAPKYRAREKRTMSSLSEEQAAKIEKRVEYAVRIVCGLLSGAFIGFLFTEDLMRKDSDMVAAVVVCAVIFGAGAVKLGDKAWREVFGIWWKWE